MRRSASRAVDLDLLLADLVADLLLPGDGLLVQADALDRHGLLLDDRALGVQGDLVLLLADGRAVHGVADVGVGDRLALDAGPPRARPGTVSVTFSVTTYLRSRARPASSVRVPTFSRSSERVMASSVVGPEVSWPTVPRRCRRLGVRVVSAMPVVARWSGLGGRRSCVRSACRCMPVPMP